jgi:hypothetical protein
MKHVKRNARQHIVAQPCFRLYSGLPVPSGSFARRAEARRVLWSRSVIFVMHLAGFPEGPQKARVQSSGSIFELYTNHCCCDIVRCVTNLGVTLYARAVSLAWATTVSQRADVVHKNVSTKPLEHAF